MNDNQIRLAGKIESDNIVNGEGLRTVIWCQGCRLHCVGCHNPESWDENSGTVININEIKNKLKKIKGQAGLTFCGGEPMLQAKACKKICEWVKKKLGWSVWSFSGYTYEEIKAEGGDKWDFLKSLDVLIDGRFIQSLHDLNLNFRGSRNQRLLRLKNGEIIGVE